MPRTIEELAEMIAKRDDIDYEDALSLIRDTAAELEYAFYNGKLFEAEDILASNLGIEPDYLDLFIF